jgi:hypothetical protein
MEFIGNYGLTAVLRRTGLSRIFHSSVLRWYTINRCNRREFVRFQLRVVISFAHGSYRRLCFGVLANPFEMLYDSVLERRNAK